MYKGKKIRRLTSIFTDIDIASQNVSLKQASEIQVYSEVNIHLLVLNQN